MVEHDGEPLIISAGDDGALRSWRVDATPGPLTREDAHTRPIGALAVVEHDGEPPLTRGSQHRAGGRQWTFGNDR